MKPYPKYKPSGVEWIKNIPEHWEALPIKLIAKKDRDSIVDGPFGSSVNVSEDYIESGVPVVRTVNITNEGFSSTDLKYMREEKYQELKRHSIIPNDILFSKVGTIGNVCFFPEFLKEGILSTTGSCRIRVDDSIMNRYYLVFLLRSMKQYFELLASANVQPFLNMSTIKNAKVLVPSINEQKYISDFIRCKTNQIDKLIGKKLQLLKLLQEEKSAVINEAVTKGLNPDVKMKDSGIAWLGEIPVHWEIKKVKFLLQRVNGVQIGPFGSSLKSEFIRATGIKIYGQENIINDNFSVGYRFIDNDKYTELEKYEVFPGDILITMMGTTGKSKIVPTNIEKGIIDSHLMRLRIDKKLFLPELFSLIINNAYFMKNNIKYESKGSIMDGLNSQIIKSLFIPYPPLNEQEIIINHIHECIKLKDRIINRIESEIGLLKEYRTSLISDAVTGKIDVRDINISE